MWSVWLIFCDCGFQSVHPLMEKDKRLRWKLGLFLMGNPKLCKSLIQFSVDDYQGRAVFPPHYLTWGQTMVELMKIMVTSFNRSHQALLHSVALTLQQATANSHLCQRLLDTHRQVWVSLLWGHCSFLLVHTDIHKIIKNRLGLLRDSSGAGYKREVYVNMEGQ